jgi:hypothetical protein
MSRKTNLLTDRQRAVIETMRMRLSEKLAIAYLKGEGFDIHPATWYREKAKLEKMKLKRLYHIAQIGFQDQHLETIDQYEIGFKMMWQNVLRERDPYKQNAMIRDILLLKPYLSSYYEATKLIIEKQPINNESEETEEQIRESSSISPLTRESPITEQSGTDRGPNSNNRKF